MKGGEARLWARMRAGIIDQCFVQRIENSVGEGVPDVILHHRLDGSCAFVELKYRPETPARSSTPIFKGDYGLRRPDQVAWNYERAESGAKVWILGQCDDKVWLVHGRFSRELDAFSRALLNFNCSWQGSARRTDWDGMLRVIFEECYGKRGSD